DALVISSQGTMTLQNVSANTANLSVTNGDIAIQGQIQSPAGTNSASVVLTTTGTGNISSIPGAFIFSDSLSMQADNGSIGTSANKIGTNATTLAANTVGNVF